jgi:hypothetical protein
MTFLVKNICQFFAYLYGGVLRRLLEKSQLVILICFLVEIICFFYLYCKLLRCCAWALSSRVTGHDLQLHFVRGQGSRWPNILAVNTQFVSGSFLWDPVQLRQGLGATLLSVIFQQ